MPTINLYVTKERMEKIISLTKGKPSLIFGKAIDEHFSTTEDSDVIKKQIVLEEEKYEMSKNKLTFLKGRYENLLKIDREKKEREAIEQKKQADAEIKAEKERLERYIKSLASYIFDKFIIEKDIAIEEAKSYFEYQEKCKEQKIDRINWINWINSKGYEFKKILKMDNLHKKTGSGGSGID